MIGINRKHVEERIAKYRLQHPNDKREDWVIGEAIGLMKNPMYYNKYLEDWIFRQVYEDQLDGESVLKLKHQK